MAEFVAETVLPTSISASISATPDFLMAIALAGTTSNVFISFDAADAEDVPTLFTATTVNVYAVPPVSPANVKVPESDCGSVTLIPPGFDVAMKEVIGAPPFFAGAVNAIVAPVAPVALALPITGASGAVFGGGVGDADADGDAEGLAEGAGVLVALATGFLTTGFFTTGFLTTGFLATGLVAPSARSPKISEPIKPLVMVIKRRRVGRLGRLFGRLSGLS